MELVRPSETHASVLVEQLRSVDAEIRQKALAEIYPGEQVLLVTRTTQACFAAWGGIVDQVFLAILVQVLQQLAARFDFALLMITRSVLVNWLQNQNRLVVPTPGQHGKLLS